MRDIQKGPEPRGLLAFRKSTPGAAWPPPGNITREMRARLIAEQRGLCGYCCRRIKVEGAIIEHIVPRSDPLEGAALTFAWGNLIASCDGHRGERPANTTCDAHKANRRLEHLDPTDAPERWVRFLRSGRVESPDERANRDLNDVLNLNQAGLVAGRKEALRRLIAAHDRGRSWSNDDIARMLEGLETSKELPPYQPVLVYWLRKRLGRQ